jgi:hypothetical protein
MPDVIPIRKIPDDPMLARLIAAIGKEHAGDAERTWFEDRFRALKGDFEARLPGFEADGKRRKLLRRFLDNAAERRRLREQLAPFRHDLARIRHIKLAGCPKDTRDVLGLLMDPDIIALAEQAEEKDFGIFLELSDDYRKGPIRKLAIEPFLVMLRNEDVEPTRERPLIRMVEALLDYLDIDPKRHPRPTKSGIETTIREAKRDFEKRPAQHPEA